MKGMNRKRKMASTIISGADGPTSVFIAGKNKNRNIFRQLQTDIRRKHYQWKRVKLKARLVPNAHSLIEVCAYVKRKYQAKEVSAADLCYKEQYRSLKASMIQKFRPELLGESLETYMPKDYTDVEAVKRFMDKCEEQVQKAAEISQKQFPFEYHQYLIVMEGCGRLDIVMDFTHDFISYSYSAEKGKRKTMDRIVKDIWLYYGVSKEDIEQESERMQALLTILASMQ